jgi:membrane protein DedA with SNARE-associated domain
MTAWITNWMESLGYWGIALLMALENIFPPIPSELIMPLAGFTVAQGKMNFGLAVLAGTVGTMVGTYFWYYIGKLMSYQRLMGWVDRYGKWIQVGRADVERVNKWFDRHGAKAIFFSRMVPGLRTLISLPAGVNNMPLVGFTLLSTLGSLLWVLLLTGAGYLLGDNYTKVEDYLAPVSKLVLFGLIGGLVYWFWRKRKKSAS